MRDKKPSPARQAANEFIDHVLKTYGDLIFDLCESVLWSPVYAQLAFRSILKQIRKEHATSPFKENERAWVLRVAFRHLQKYSQRHGRRLTSSEQIELDAAQAVASRLKRFDSYFHRLAADDQILLILRDKYGIPFVEISSAMAAPEDSLKVKRQHALRALEEWLWSQA